MKRIVLVLLLLLGSVLRGDSSPRSTASVGGRPYPIHEEVKPVRRTNPVVPYEAAKERRGGTIRVGVLIDEAGKVKRTYRDKSDAQGDLVAAALQAVQEWEFPVVKEAGAPVAYVTFVLISFDNGTTPPAARKPTLAEIIADPRNLRQALGTKGLLVTDAKTGQVSDELMKAVKRARLTEGIQLYPLPASAVSPVPEFRAVPDALRSKYDDATADFLIVIGANGTVQGIYCLESSDPEFAVAGAAAVLKWRYRSATIDGTPVPVIANLRLHLIRR